ncbi:MAG: two-component regulator propeller domain-containing protein [Prolixibacteraceae bacterium]|jgi:signal transduction histidine kinase/DNA-binding response OmpR family regulator
MFSKKSFIVILLLIVNGFTLFALPYHIRRIDSRDGLSNSAVLSLYQDKNDFLWVGTYNGLDRYDGKFIKTFGLDERDNSVQSSNIIENIQGAGDNCLWLSTYIGLNKFSIKQQKVIEFYPNYRFPYNLTANNKGLTCLIAKKGYISVYSRYKKTFIDILSPEIDPASVVASFFDPGDRLWVFTNAAKIYKFKISDESPDNPKEPEIEVQEVNFGDNKIISAFEENGLIFLINSTGDFYSYDTERDRNNYIRNIHDLIKKYGTISSIISYHDDFIISFKNNGVLKLVSALKYKEEFLDMNSGVFCLKKDREKDIVWIGFDGQGLGIYNNKTSIFNTIASSSLPIPIRKPIRCIFTDKNNTLWAGTKGDGLILINDYDRASFENIPASKVHYYTTRDGLSNNQVFAISPSAFYPINWLGTEGPGISYFSLNDKKIYTLQNPTSTPIRRVHSIAEQNDSTIWLATAGHGLLRVIIEEENNQLKIKNIETFFFTRNDKIVNDLFAMYKDKNNCLWIGSRGDGVIRFKMSDESYEFITSGKKFNSSTDDIITYCHSKSSHFYFGSCAGLLKLNEENDGSKLEEVPNKYRTGMKEMIHGMQEDEKGCLWMGTNRGIEKYNPSNNMFYKYYQHTGLNVIEFSDNADYTCPYTHRIFFGGVDGIVWIEPNIPEIQISDSPIHFTGLKLNGINENLNNYLKESKDEHYLGLNSKQNTFSVSFVAVDYMYGMDMQYSYRLKGYNSNWVNSNDLNEAQFNLLPYGDYTLEVKFRNDVFDTESMPSYLKITVLPPWYLSNVAKTAYALFLFLIIILSATIVRKKARQRQEAFNKSIIEKNKEELYKTKMKFFANITHEFLTPLTLMQGPCERILSYENSDGYVRQYTTMLHSNADKLKELVQEIISFSKNEELNSLEDTAERIEINKFIKSIRTSFSETIERNGIDFIIECEKDLAWNTSNSGLNRIMMNLISNAFKYTPVGGKIRISSHIKEDNLIFCVYNTGSGFTKDEISKVFDRYSILNNMEKNAYLDHSSRNGLGLAICYSTIQQLKGSVEVKSEKNGYAEFIVRIPAMTLQTDLTDKNNASSVLMDFPTVIPSGNVKNNGQKQIHQRILVVDDNKDIVSMISEALIDKYDIIKAFNTEQVLNLLKNVLPDLIIADLMMPGEMDGMDLIKKLKSDQFTSHIPIIIISAKVSIEDQMQGVEYGADIYLTKPFNLAYLKSIIEQLIKKEGVLRDYYNSPISAIELNEGRFIHQNDQDFLLQVTSVIDENIELGDLHPEQIAEALKLSPQTFYRKLKAISSQSPRGFIKKYRFSVAAKMLITTNISVQEIMYKVGINNRSYFYREFAKLYDCTPKDFRDLNKNDIYKKQAALLNIQ